ncbi:unnamed protein product [Blepharisma stoltei]|uniref:t-SNARE coiled-coil homology domain-containing protein n=1 Tax=Blepharisma stoltei TaxID=1481888 RepID=A0AAU9JKU2_9CILI|nr:unnamed protein product [Blepharisma stoltei]
MEDFHDWSDSAYRSLSRLEVIIKNSEKNSKESSQEFFAECEKEIRKIELNLEYCEQSIHEINSPNKEVCKIKYNELSDKLNRCKAELEFKNQNKRNLFGNRLEENKENEKQDLSNVSAQELITKGYRLYQEAEERMLGIYGKTEEIKSVASAIEAGLYEQEQKIDKIGDEVNDLRGVLRRTDKIMNQIYRRYLTDKCILCLIITILIVLVTIIIYGIANGKSLGFPNDTMK